MQLLQALEKKFNGDVFSLPEGSRLTKSALRSFARLVEARTLDGQRYLWNLYSFKHIPVEVISHLYQRFVRGSTAVYTPPFVAAMLLDFAMPYHELNGRERVMDPACGSGVFLVGAFRRLVNLWRANHGWRKPTVEVLKSILRNQIFGVEVESGAVDLTAFSLALAVCDSLQPDVIWSQLRFDRLRDSNLREGDFFGMPLAADCKTANEEKFDVIIGNPPFESKLTECAKQVNESGAAERGHIPDNQIAYLFLDHSLRILKSTSRLCLIQPSGFLYNLKCHAFRSFVASSQRVEAVFDFTSVRGMFEGADPKTIAVVLGAKQAPTFTHLTFRRTFRTAQRIGFELDHYDRHELSVDDIRLDSKAARPNLFGGGRLGLLASRLRKMTTVGEHVRKKGWLMGEGFNVGKKTHTAEYLTGKPLLPTHALTKAGVDKQAISTVTETEFE